MDNSAALDADNQFRYIPHFGLVIVSIVSTVISASWLYRRNRTRLMKIATLVFVILNLVYAVKIAGIIGSFYMSEWRRTSRGALSRSMDKQVPLKPAPDLHLTSKEGQKILDKKEDKQVFNNKEYERAFDNNVKKEVNKVGQQTFKSDAILTDSLVGNAATDSSVLHWAPPTQTPVNIQATAVKLPDRPAVSAPSRLAPSAAARPAVSAPSRLAPSAAARPATGRAAPSAPFIARPAPLAVELEPNSVELELNSAYPGFGDVPYTSIPSEDVYFNREEQVNVLLVSSWRSGSTLFSRILATHQNVFLHNEPLDEPFTASLTASTVREYTSNVTDRLLACKYQDIEVGHLKRMYAARGYLRKGTKIPEMCNGPLKKSNPCMDQENMSLLCNKYPIQMVKFLRISLAQIADYLDKYVNFKIIWLYRDPRAVWNSRVNNEKVNFWCLVGICGDLQRLCQSYDINLKVSEQLQSSHPKRFIMEKFEDFLADPYKETDKILTFLEIRAETSDEVFKNIMSVDDKTYFESRRNWKDELSEGILKEVEDKCGNAITQLNYPQTTFKLEKILDNEVEQKPEGNQIEDNAVVRSKPRNKNLGNEVLPLINLYRKKAAKKVLD